MRALVAGLGSAGRRHLRNLHALGVRDLLAFRVRGAPVEEVDALGVVEYRSLADALDRQPDVVFVTNPTDAHLTVALEAARRGCHLFIEKPLSDDLAGVDELIDVVREKRLVAMVGCNYRFNPALQRVKALLREDSIGRVITARAHAGEYLPGWHPGEDWRASYAARRDMGGGVILTQIHELDYLFWLFGDVSGVFALTGSWSGFDLDVEDAAEILLEFRQGLRASIHLDYVQRPRARSLELIAERGQVQWDFYSGLLRTYVADTGRWTEWSGPSFDRRNDTFIDELRHFLDCIERRSEPLIPLAEGRRVLEIALAAKRSGATREFVHLQSAAAAVASVHE